MRTTHYEVTFAKAFTLPGLDGIQRAGTYRISTDEEEFATMNHQGYRRVATMIAVRSDSGVLEQFAINPVDLEAALLRDSGSTLVPS